MSLHDWRVSRSRCYDSAEKPQGYERISISRLFLEWFCSVIIWRDMNYWQWIVRAQTGEITDNQLKGYTQGNFWQWIVGMHCGELLAVSCKSRKRGINRKNTQGNPCQWIVVNHKVVLLTVNCEVTQRWIIGTEFYPLFRVSVTQMDTLLSLCRVFLVVCFKSAARSRNCLT